MPQSMRVRRLSVTPVKGLSLHHPDSVEVDSSGIRGDRRFYLVAASGKPESCTANGALMRLTGEFHEESGELEVRRGDTVLRRAPVPVGEPVVSDFYGLRTLHSTVVADEEWHQLFSGVIGKPVRLAESSGPARANDVEPLTLISSESVAALAGNAGLEGIDSRRFRMNIEFEGATPHLEDEWLEREIRIGEVTVRGGGPVSRCAATTRDPDTGGVNLKVTSLIIAYRGRQDSIFGLGPNLGVYAQVVEPGRIRVGDPVEPI